MVKHTQTTTNCLSVFDHFVRLALKGLRWVLIGKFRSHLNIVDGALCKYRWRLKAVCHFRKNIHRRCLYLQQTPTFPTQLSLRFRDGQYIWKSALYPPYFFAKAYRSMEALRKVFFWKYETPTYENLTSQTGYKCPFKETRLV